MKIDKGENIDKGFLNNIKNKYFKKEIKYIELNNYSKPEALLDYLNWKHKGNYLEAPCERGCAYVKFNDEKRVVTIDTEGQSEYDFKPIEIYALYLKCIDLGWV